ncbi:MAG: helicase-related protein [Pseudomonadota bacterium]
MSLKAVLGPTNTGKTHYALERMMGHATGMIGLPLRLLAREVYDRVVAAKGAASVALVTGEERIEPKTARYWVCTVESMPVNKRVDCLAIDEIQLAEDRDRGHVFTDRILHCRGNSETLLLGSETMRPLLARLGLQTETLVRERFSQLAHVPPIKLTKLPKRSAIVAFNSDAVYGIAELLRRHKGGAAVVMGALSPRTRNAQVELYQNGEVDYLVATDAIGMGLNLDVDMVAFAGRSKFDGRRHRMLTAAECGQIAGRAGRFRTDGVFCATGDCAPFEEEDVRAIENHTFDPVDDVQWRNSDLDFRSIKTLIASLARPSGRPELRQNPDALDEWVLRRMAEDALIGPDVRGTRVVRRLWDLARLPDFRKAGHDGHGRLVLGLAETLRDPDARLGNTAMEKRLEALSLPRGDIASLQQRLANIRTWTYAAHREDWLENPEHWREKTRQIEDRLSDALHDALAARFVDKRTTALLAGMKREDALVTDINASGDVSVEGHIVGHLKGLSFEPVSNARSLEGKAVRGAAATALKPILARRLNEITTSGDLAFQLSDAGALLFGGDAIARLAKGPDWLSPRVELIGGEEAEANQKEAARQRLELWVSDERARKLPTLHALKFGEAAAPLEGLARGLAFRILETGAAIDLRQDDPSHRMEPAQRDAFRAAGLRTGRVAAYVPDALKPAAQKLITCFRTVFDDDVCQAPPEGAGSFKPDTEWRDLSLHATGFLRFGWRAVRADLAERLAWEVSKRRKEAEKNLFALPPELASIVSTPADEFAGVLKGIGLQPAEKDPETGAPTLWRYASRSRPDMPGRARKPRGDKPDQDRQGRGAPSGKRDHKRDEGGKAQRRNQRPQQRRPDPNSPFAALAVLLPDEKPKAKPRKKKKKKPAAKPAATFNYTPFR